MDNSLQKKRTTLPRLADFTGLPVEEVIRRRRSQRHFSTAQMTLEELAGLLQHAVGITGERRGRKLRAAPSAGATFPIETYLVIHRVQELQPGLYRYAVPDHALELLQAGDLRREIVQRGLDQDFLGQANLVVIFSAFFPRIAWKYGERSYPYALLEAGHLGQNIYLVAAALGLGACAVGSFHDEGLNALLGADGFEETAVYMLAVGKI